MNIICGIYKIESKIKPERIYIGSTVDFKNRKNGHLHLLRLGKHDNNKLQHHFNKYGEDDLIFSLIAMCKREDLIPIDKIVRPEQFFIWAYDPWFNICKIAGSVIGRSCSEDAKSKISNTLRGNVPWNKGLTKDTNCVLREISESMKGNQNSIGRVVSDECKRKTSDRMKGSDNPNVGGKCSWNKGKKGLQVAWNKGKHTHPKIQEMLRMLGEKCKVAVLQYDKDGVFIKEWDSLARVQRELKISATGVMQCAKGRAKSAGGYVWKYKDVA